MASVNTSCASVEGPLNRYYLPVSYGIIFIVGLLGNTTSIGIYVTKLRPWKSSSIIMVNLALTDLLYVLTMPFLVYYYSSGGLWALGDFTCRFVRFAFHFHLYASILFLSCMAVFRYVAVVWPLRGVRLQQRIWGVAACSVIWVVAAAEITPMLTLISLHREDNDTRCLDFASTRPVGDVRQYGWVLTALGFGLPLAVVLSCYVGIVKQLTKGPDPSSTCRMRARRVTVLILVVFVTCFLPYHVLRVLWIETRSSSPTPCMMNTVQAAYIVSRPLAGLNTVFNLALFTLSGDRFWRAFLGSFQCEHWVSKARSLLNLSISTKAGRDSPAA
ncbi:2-oxoglutarate receptor 1-like [Nematolebias whitei]|uniref:2-oxoglutarate receptor 1-like n=1 Tax=Nematolebias whitei TaxID=451745 RepID=UPI0018987C60|nr:2-oxoglutarate receptor 1-like [Nematolebias whitei]